MILDPLNLIYTAKPWYPGHFGDDTINCECKSIVEEGYTGGLATIHVSNGLSLISEGGNDCPPKEEAIGNMLLMTFAPDMYETLKLIIELSDNASSHDLGEIALSCLKTIGYNKE